MTDWLVHAPDWQLVVAILILAVMGVFAWRR